MHLVFAFVKWQLVTIPACFSSRCKGWQWSFGSLAHAVTERAGLGPGLDLRFGRSKWNSRLEMCETNKWWKIGGKHHCYLSGVAKCRALSRFHGEQCDTWHFFKLLFRRTTTPRRGSKNWKISSVDSPREFLITPVLWRWCRSILVCLPRQRWKENRPPPNNCQLFLALGM